MRVTRVVLEAPSYDPASGSARALKARDSFEQSEGYDLELAGDCVLVSHSGHTTAFPLSRVAYMLVEKEQAAQATSGQPASQQWKGKRR